MCACNHVASRELRSCSEAWRFYRWVRPIVADRNRGRLSDAMELIATRHEHIHYTLLRLHRLVGCYPSQRLYLWKPELGRRKWTDKSETGRARIGSFPGKHRKISCDDF